MTNRSELEVRVTGRDDLSPELQRIESRLIRFVGAVSSALTAVRVAAFPVNAIRAFEREMANVQKTTNFARGELDQLSKSLVDLSRRIDVSATDLAKIAAAAGQQGLGRYGVEGIEQFTESVARMSSVLDVSVDDAGANIGKITSIFNIALQDVERVVSAFNEVSNNSTASGEQLLDVVKRIGNAAGSLSLDQAIGVAATGLDLGQSPEVVGTSFAKVFSEMFARADEFSKLLGVSVNEWLTTLQGDGVKALQMYLQGLRKLSEDEQQKWIKQLSGGGRIGVLVTKLVQDVEDAILRRNVAFGAEGFESGTSALKEQQTVLATLDAEIKKAGNSFQALGIKAGEQFAGPLATYFAQLNAALADDDVIAFAEQIGKTFLDIFETIVELTKVLAGLNINWENFVVLAKGLLALKLASFFSTKIANVGNLAAAYQTAGAAAADGAKVEQAAAQAGINTIRGQIAQIREMIVARRQYTQALQAQSTLEAAATKQAQDLTLARIEQRAAKDALANAYTNIGQGRPEVEAAKQAAIAAERAAASNVESIRAQHQAKLQTAATEHSQRLLLIDAEFRAKKQAADATGNKALLAAATATKTQQLSAEEAYYARSMRGIESYYARRLRVQQEKDAALLLQSRTALAAQLTAFDTTVAAQNLVGLQGNIDRTSERTGRLNTQLSVMQARLAELRTQTLLASTAFGRFRAGIALIGRSLNVLIGVLSKAFFWFTILYTVLDLTGLLDNVAGAFTFVTDALGLTSEANRKAAREAELHADAMRDQAKAAIEAREALEKYLDPITRGLEAGFVAQVKLTIDDPDPQVAQKGIDAYLDAGEQIIRTIEQTAADRLALPGRAEAISEELVEAREKLAEFQEEVAFIQQAINDNVPEGAPEDFFVTPALEEAQAAVEQQEAAVRKLEERYESFGETAQASAKKAAGELERASQDFNELTRSVLTSTAADLFSEVAPEYLKQLEAANAAKAEYDRLLDEAGRTEGEAAKEAAYQAAEGARLQVGTAKRALEEIRQNLAIEVARIKAEGNVGDAIIGSLDFLPRLLGASSTQIDAILKSIRDIRQAGLEFTGENAPAPIQSSSGDGTVPGRETESEARKLSKARVELAQAELQSIANLQQQHNKETQEELDFSYSRNLLSIRNFYAERKRLQQESIDIDLNQKREEIKALNKELVEAQIESARVRVQTQIVKAQGDLDVLQARRDALERETEREQDDALRAFADQAASQKAALLDFFGSTDANEVFRIALDEATRTHRDALEKMEAQAADFPELLPFIDAAKLQSQFLAVEAVLNGFQRQAALVGGQVDFVDARLSALRDNGLVTVTEYAASLDAARQSQIAFLTQVIAKEEEYLATLYDETKTLDDQSIRYKELALEIQERRSDLQLLQLESNEVAKQINDELRGALKGFLTDLANGEDVAQALETFGLRMLDTLVDIAAEELATKALRAVGSVGDQGVGGLLAGILGAGAERGTELNPMVVRQAATDDLFDAGKDAVKDTTADVLGDGDTLSDVTDTVSETSGGIMSGLSDVGSQIVDGLGSGLSSLGGLLQGLFATLTAAIIGSSASDAASGLGGFLSSVGASQAHIGGVVGRLAQSRTGLSPAVFANAMRYHGGGLPGLSKDEVATILLKGEEVLTRDDPRNVLNGGRGGSTGGGNNTPILKQRLLPILDPDLISEALRGAAGEELVELIITRNPGKFNSILKRG